MGWFIVLFSNAWSIVCAEDLINNREENQEIYVFIHVCTIGQWEEILEKQLARIVTSGLYDASCAISLGVLGEGVMDPFLKRYPKITILFQDPRKELFERPTVLYVHDFCMDKPDALILYLHTKGVTRQGSRSVWDWTNYMEYFNIDCWRDCVVALTKEHYDICGVNWQWIPHPHFSGNFWWATGRYISTLPHYIGCEWPTHPQIDPEMWLGQNSPKYKCFHHSHLDHYRSLYPESKYKNS
jgi:hypothetical protein